METRHGILHNVIHKENDDHRGLKLPIPIPNLVPPIPNIIPPLPVPGLPNLFQPKNLFQGGLAGALLWKPVYQFFENFFLNNNIIKHLEDLAKYLAERPYLSMPLFVLGLSFLTPVLVFVFFAFVTAFVTFSGFLIAEGALLSMGAIIVGSFLLSTFGISVVACTLFGVMYFGLQKAKLVK